MFLTVLVCTVQCATLISFTSYYLRRVSQTQPCANIKLSEFLYLHDSSSQLTQTIIKDNISSNSALYIVYIVYCIHCIYCIKSPYSTNLETTEHMGTIAASSSMYMFILSLRLFSIALWDTLPEGLPSAPSRSESVSSSFEELRGVTC